MIIQTPSKLFKLTKKPKYNSIEFGSITRMETIAMTMPNKKEEFIPESNIAIDDPFAIITIEKENKRKKEQLSQMINRIRKMKQKEEVYYSQMQKMKLKEERDEYIKQYKKEIKDKLKEKQNEVEKVEQSKKRYVDELKKRQEFELRAYQITREAKSQSLVFRNKNEKKAINEMLIENKVTVENANQYKHLKIKKEFIQTHNIIIQKKEFQKIEKRKKTLNKVNTLLIENISIQNQIDSLEQIENECLNNYSNSNSNSNSQIFTSNQSQRNQKVLSHNLSYIYFNSNTNIEMNSKSKSKSNRHTKQNK